MTSTTSEAKETVDRRLDQDLKTVVAMLLYDSLCNFEIPVADGLLVWSQLDTFYRCCF